MAKFAKLFDTPSGQVLACADRGEDMTPVVQFMGESDGMFRPRYVSMFDTVENRDLALAAFDQPMAERMGEQLANAARQATRYYNEQQVADAIAEKQGAPIQ